MKIVKNRHLAFGILIFYYFTILLFYYLLFLLFYYFTILLFYYFIILLFLLFIVLSNVPSRFLICLILVPNLFLL